MLLSLVLLQRPLFDFLKTDNYQLCSLPCLSLITISAESSFAGDDKRSDINGTYLQPFLSYITDTHTTISLNSESTYNWVDHEWNAPVNLIVNQLFRVGGQPIQIGVGPRYWIDSPDAGADGWGVRAVFTLLFPQ